jgi:hypothetical protein
LILLSSEIAKGHRYSELLFSTFAAINAKNCIGWAEAHGRRDQRDGRNNQRRYPPCRFDGSRQSDKQQRYPKYDTADAINSADIALHDDLLMPAR